MNESSNTAERSHEVEAADAAQTSPTTQQDAEKLHTQGIAAFSAGRAEEAVQLIVHATELNPQKAHYFLSLGRVLANQTMFNQATLAYLRAQELAPQNTVILTELALVLKHLGKHDEASALLRHAANLQGASGLAPQQSAKPREIAKLPGESVGGSPLTLQGFQFATLHLYGDANGASLIGLSSDDQQFLKVEIHHNPLKKLTLDGERQILEDLNRDHCVTCPSLTGHGVLSRGELESCLTAHGRNVLAAWPSPTYSYIVQQFIPATGVPSLGDILLAVLEQKALGVFHADLRPENCRFDAKTGVCYLIDYDQAERLDDVTRNLGNLAFFDWCDGLVREKYKQWGFQSFLHYFPTIDRQQAFRVLFRDGSFNLATTRLFTNQITTASRAGIYHTIREPAVYIDGERSLDSRRAYLDGIDFKPGERVLDVGCSSGIVSTYLARRGCKVTGIDLDPEIIRGCRILAHILGNDISFLHHDLDSGPVVGEFDTVLLFSVIHHTKNLRDNAAHLAGQSKRIIIECRLEEGGLKPSEHAGWQKTSGWSYSTIEDLVNGLEQLFPGFRLHKNHGQGDRDRYVLEFSKTT